MRRTRRIPVCCAGSGRSGTVAARPRSTTSARRRPVRTGRNMPGHRRGAGALPAGTAGAGPRRGASRGVLVVTARRKPERDLDELERMLAASGGGPEDIDRARRSSDGLGLFIRSLVGLDREAANEAFSEFLAGRTLTANQISFIDLIVAHLTRNGVMEPVRLYESPFSDIAPDLESIFSSADVDRLVTIIKSVRDTAAPRARWLSARG
ncbi:hypothetical protein E1258_24950, partial [Micromonospora sp. KC207]